MLTEPVTRAPTATGPAPMVTPVAAATVPGPYRLVSGTPQYRPAQGPVTYTYPMASSVPYQMPGGRVLAAPQVAPQPVVSSAAVSTKGEVAPVSTLPPLQSAQAMPPPQMAPGSQVLASSVSMVATPAATATPPMVASAACATPTSIVGAPQTSVVGAPQYQSPVAASMGSPVAVPQVSSNQPMPAMDAAAAQPNFHVPEAGAVVTWSLKVLVLLGGSSIKGIGLLGLGGRYLWN